MITGPASKGKGSPAGCAIFSLVFLGMGSLFLYFLFVQPVVGILNSRSWTPTPCVIVSSRVKEGRTSKGRRTYELELRFRYSFAGQSYESTRYNWAGLWSSSWDESRAVVRRLPAGEKTVCYVDPARPQEAVLERGWRASLLFGLFPGILIAIGLTGFYSLLRPKRSQTRTGERRKSPSLPSTPEEPPGPKILRPTESPLAVLFGCLILGMVWNGILGVVLAENISRWLKGDKPWFPTLFLIPFVAIGLLLLGGVFRQILVLLGPRVKLTLGQGWIPLGGWVDLRWETTGNLSRIQNYRIVLEGKERATYGTGKQRGTKTEIFSETTVAEGPGGEDLRSGSALLTVPAHLMPSFQSDHNAIVWSIRLEGIVPFWPNVKGEYEVQVVPKGGP